MIGSNVFVGKLGSSNCLTVTSPLGETKQITFVPSAWASRCGDSSIGFCTLSIVVIDLSSFLHCPQPLQPCGYGYSSEACIKRDEFVKRELRLS